MLCFANDASAEADGIELTFDEIAQLAVRIIELRLRVADLVVCLRLALDNALLHEDIEAACRGVDLHADVVILGIRICLLRSLEHCSLNFLNEQCLFHTVLAAERCQRLKKAFVHGNGSSLLSAAFRMLHI